jgi:hypothetical protein
MLLSRWVLLDILGSGRTALFPGENYGPTFRCDVLYGIVQRASIFHAFAVNNHYYTWNIAAYFTR